MKRKFIHRIKKIAIFFLLLTLCLTEVHPIYADETDNVIEIKAVEDFLKLAENCKLDVYSIGKVVELKDDINLSGNNFSGIPYFNGTFHGNGFTISGIDNFSAISGCATHIRMQLNRLKAQLQAEQEAEEAVKKQVAAAQANAGEVSA